MDPDKVFSYTQLTAPSLIVGEVTCRFVEAWMHSESNFHFFFMSILTKAVLWKCAWGGQTYIRIRALAFALIISSKHVQ